MLPSPTSTRVIMYGICNGASDGGLKTTSGIKLKGMLSFIRIRCRQ